VFAAGSSSRGAGIPWVDAEKELLVANEKLAEMPPGMTAFDMTDPKPAPKRDGSVQRETFEKVQALVTQGASKMDAIAQVAAEQGKKVGEVQGAYYAARSKHLAPPIRPSANPGVRKGSRRSLAPSAVSSYSPELSVLVSRVAADLQDLVSALDAERRRSAAIRARLDQGRSTLGS
jgi:hypothetical protein